MKKFTLSLVAAVASVMSLSAVNADNLYVVGNACAAGWSPDDALEMTKVSDNVFTWTGELNAAGEFKFIMARDWHPSITCDFNTESQQNVTISGGNSYDLFERPGENDGQDNKFQVAVTGVYTLNIDLNDMKMAVNLDEEIEEPLKIYAVGNATPGGWDLDNAMKQQFRQEENGHYVWSGELTLENPDDDASGRFRFITSHEWWPSYTTANEEGDTEAGVGVYDLRFCETSPDPEAAFRINATGTYVIDLDIENLQMTITEKAEELYIMGNALTGAAGVWDLQWAQACTPTANAHEFEWNGFLFNEDEEGLPTQFKFICQDYDWNPGYVSTDENEQIAIGKTYTIGSTKTDPDWKFTVPAEGYYKLTINTEKLTMAVAEGAGVDVVEAENATLTVNGLQLAVAGGVADVYDAMGRTIATDAAAVTLPAAGIYVVVVDGKALKIAAK